MSQEFHVLKCFSCETFQVHIVKKAKKWECKMCGAKQSLKRNYGKGSSKDCRNQVMKLNELRLAKCSTVDQTEDEIPEETWIDEPKEESKVQIPPVSKWAEYVEENVPNTESESEENLLEFVEKKKKRVKKMPGNYYSKSKKICGESSDGERFSNTAKLSSGLTNNEKSFSFNEIADRKDFVPPKSKSDSGKYTKYLLDDEVGSDTAQKVQNKTLNIFESSLTDLDDILNF